ncbi:hypothetical protein N752_01380 [Desulforamulus aquiferis]|nr:hypothetical protein [Desulforamulus aquiferis]RYD06971.1 hypothetical protein N752_01380 [Desulforamulus aquiferis]
MRCRAFQRIIIFTLLILLTGGIYTFSPGERQAVKRTQGFIDAVNENRPGDVYKYLTPELRNGISKEAFIENFKKERSYPYLTPLYFYLDEVKLSPDGKGGKPLLQ